MSDQRAVEVIVMWGESSVLDVKHLSPARTYTVGDAVDAKGRIATDFMVSTASLGGREQLPLLIVDGEQLRLSITREMQGCVEIDGATCSFEELRERGLLTPSSEVEEAEQYVLPDDASAQARVEVRLGELRFVMRRVIAVSAAQIARSPLDWKGYGWVIASLLFHAFFLVAFYFLPPQAMARNLELLNMDQRYIDYVIEPPETVEPDLPDFVAADASGEDGKAHDGESGQMGKPTSTKTKKHYAIAGEAKPEDRQMSKEAAQEMAKNIGVIGVLKTVSGTWDAPTSIYGADTAVGSDAINAIGALTGVMAGENFGWNGLGPVGTGRGGGGDGRGTVGTGKLGTIGGMGGPGGHGSGGYCGDSTGASCGGGFRGRDARTPKLTLLPAEVRGGLSKEVIRREIRRHLAEIRHCYEQELTSRPDLEGRVAVKFMINTDGVVQMASVMQSTLGNARAESCITSAVTRWTFPSGTGLSVVSYPFLFEQSQ